MAPVNSPTRVWLSRVADGDTWLFDAGFLASNWNCIFGRGCKGILEEDASQLNHGCCTHGAHFADAADRKNIQARIAALRPDQWQNHDLADTLGGAIAKTDGAWTTRTHDGVCIMHNTADFPGGLGCALHRAALEAGERPVDWKPQVCWQLPLRLETHIDENDRRTHVLRAWDREDWGEGGEAFHWWCTESADAFDGEHAVVDELRDEIIELVGAELYEWIRDELRVRFGKLAADERGAWVGIPKRRVSPG